VFRANLDGSSAETIVRVTIRHPHGVAVFADEGKLYFTDDELDAVFRANLDGPRLDRLPIAGISVPGEIALDPVARKLYWTDTPSGPGVRRANLDGSGAEVVVSRANTPSLARAIGLCVDPLGGRIYFTDGGSTGTDRVLRTDLDGAGLEILVGSGLSGPRRLALAR
jgi:DNA-binding beta-propeller fold protein YncE